MNKKYYSVADVAQLLGLSKAETTELMMEDDCPSIEINNNLYIEAEDFDAWLVRHANKQHKYVLELSSTEDMVNFAEAVASVDADVRIRGKDENGNDWEVSGKSMLSTLLVASRLEYDRERKKQGKSSLNDVDWNTIYCECEVDIYARIQQFIKGNCLD